MIDNEIINIYMNFKFSIQTIKDEKKFANDFSQDVLENVDLDYYDCINEYIKNILIFYPLVFKEIKNDVNINKRNIGENEFLKKKFNKALREHNLLKAVDLIVSKVITHDTNIKPKDRNTIEKLEFILSNNLLASTVKDQLNTDIRKNIGKYLLNNNTKKDEDREININNLCIYIFDELELMLIKNNEKLDKGFYNKKDEKLKKDILDDKKEYLYEELLQTIKNGECIKTFWDRY